MERWLKIAAIVVGLILLAMIWKGQTTEAANAVKGGGSIIFDFFGNLGSFIGKLFS